MFILQLNIKDSKFAKHVEGRVSFNDLVSFVCENKDDMNLFKELMDKQKIRVNIIHSTATNLAQYQPPVPIENLRLVISHEILVFSVCIMYKKDLHAGSFPNTMAADHH